MAAFCMTPVTIMFLENQTYNSSYNRLNKPMYSAYNLKSNKLYTAVGNLASLYGNNFYGFNSNFYNNNAYVPNNNLNEYGLKPYYCCGSSSNNNHL